MNILKLRQDIEAHLIEDLGGGDITTNAIFSSTDEGSMQLIAKENGVFSGVQIIQTAFRIVDPETLIKILVTDGESICKGQQLAIISGKISALLSAERTVLNLLQRMCGIASLTKKAVDALNSPHSKITDTRKTTPGLRMLEKYAVRCGGGSNHRFGLYDAVMIKDNHIAFAGSIKKAVYLVKEYGSHMVRIEVETETKKQVLEAVEAGVDVIMLDNRTVEEINQLVPLVPNHILTEASGNIQLENLPKYAAAQIDYISLGCLTHSYQALDISAKVWTN